MANKTKKASKRVTTKRVRTRAPKVARAGATTKRKVVTEVRTFPVKPVQEVVTEKRVIETVPEVEIRRQATLAGAFTNPPVAVVKPKTRVRSVQRTRRIA